jgi:hypothetical protein
MRDVIDLRTILGFDWDEGNLKKNEIKHGVTVRECEDVFCNQPFVRSDTQHSQTEQRFAAFGETNRGRLLAISFTVRDRTIRVISARDQSRKERREYELATNSTV